MELSKDEECQRAKRICFMTTDYHDRITIIYECLVDREFDVVLLNLDELISEFKLVKKSLENDEF